LRYINGKYERNIDMMYFKNEIGDILKEIIRKDIPLEINTSGIGNFYGEYMPDAAVLRLYADLGGRYMALGSDAHASQYIGNAFGEAGALLRSLGLREYAVFRKRKMTVYPI
jgi:histidinol-phosphatase (PHP family)